MKSFKKDIISAIQKARTATIHKSNLVGLTGRDRWFVFWTQVRYNIHKMAYKSPADPYKIISVDPETVDTWINDYGITKHNGLGQIRRGEWEVTELHEHKKFNGLVERFVENKNWCETEYYEYISKRFRYKQEIEGYSDMCEYKEGRLEYIDNLYQNIRENGYQRNLKAKNNPPEISRNSSVIHSLEPLVAIDSDGTIHLVDGFHRFAIAKILGLNNIPTLVSLRHRDWQKIRDKTQLNQPDNQTQKFRTHPDISSEMR